MLWGIPQGELLTQVMMTFNDYPWKNYISKYCLHYVSHFVQATVCYHMISFLWLIDFFVIVCLLVRIKMPYIIIIVADDLAPNWHQVISNNNDDSTLIKSLWPMLCSMAKIQIKSWWFSFNKLHLKILCAKCWSHCLVIDKEVQNVGQFFWLLISLSLFVFSSWECISNFVPHLIAYVITYPCWGWS